MNEEIKLPKEEEDAKAKNEGGKEVGEEIKLLVEEELTASDGEREPDQGGGQRSPNLVEDMNSQNLEGEKLTASELKKRAGPR